MIPELVITISGIRTQEYADGSRRALMRKFPFVVVYTVESDAVVITALFHTSRNPVDLER